MNVYARFDEIPSITLKDIKKTKCYGRTDARTDGRTCKQYTRPQTQFAGGYNKYIFLFAISAAGVGCVAAPKVLPVHHP